MNTTKATSTIGFGSKQPKAQDTGRESLSRGLDRMRFSRFADVDTSEILKAENPDAELQSQVKTLNEKSKLRRKRQLALGLGSMGFVAAGGVIFGAIPWVGAGLMMAGTVALLWSRSEGISKKVLSEDAKALEAVRGQVGLDTSGWNSLVPESENHQEFKDTFRILHAKGNGFAVDGSDVIDYRPHFGDYEKQFGKLVDALENGRKLEVYVPPVDSQRVTVETPEDLKFLAFLAGGSADSLDNPEQAKAIASDPLNKTPYALERYRRGLS